MRLEPLGRLLILPYVVDERRVDDAWADGVDTDMAIFQVERPGARERAHGSLGSAVDAESFLHCSGSENPSVEDDRTALVQERQRLLHREEDAFHIGVEGVSKLFLGNIAQGGSSSAASVGKEHIDAAMLPL